MGLLDSYRLICFYGGGAKVTQHNGMIQYITPAPIPKCSKPFIKNFKGQMILNGPITEQWTVLN